MRDTNFIVSTVFYLSLYILLILTQYMALAVWLPLNWKLDTFCYCPYFLKDSRFLLLSLILSTVFNNEMIQT